MYKSYETILKEMTEKLPNDIDKSEGSIVQMMISPIAMQIYDSYFYGSNIKNSVLPDTAVGEDLTRVCSDFGVNRLNGVCAVRKVEFRDNENNFVDVDIGCRFGINGLVYTVIEKIEVGIFKVQCGTKGRIGNLYFGEVLPIDNLNSLGKALLLDILISGEEVESDEALRERFFIKVNSKPFGGNVAEYKVEILKIDGVGDVRVFATPDNIGGLVGCVIVDVDRKPVTENIVEKVQNIICPKDYKGYGIAPIGHKVIITTTNEVIINIDIQLELSEDVDIAYVEPKINEVLVGYLDKIAFVESIIRLSKIEALILGVDGVVDVYSVLVNGQPSNAQLNTRWDNYETPILGAVNIHEVR